MKYTTFEALELECESLRQQLADNDLFDSDRNQWRNNYRSKIADLTDQLAAAQAAIKAKDGAIKNLLPWVVTQVVACNGLKCREAVCLSCTEESEAEANAQKACDKYSDAKKALAIQPDDSALKAWLGEPRSYLYKFNSEFGDGTFWSHRPTHNGNTALESIPLYAPKGMTK